MTLRPRGAALLAVAAIAVAAAVPAGAQQAKPTPTSCAGLTFTDPAGDQQLQLTVLVPLGPTKLPHTTPENTDLLSGFMRYVPDGTGKNVLTANIHVANLDTTVDSGSSGTVWYFYFTVGEDIRSVSADMDTSGQFTYRYGNLGGEQGPGNNTDGETTGTTYMGKDGIISIVVPVEQMGLANKTLTNVYASSRVSIREPATGRGLVPTADDGPDNQAGKSFKVTPCAEGGTPTPVTPGGDTPAPPSDGGGTQQPAPGGGASAGGPATLDLQVVAGRLSAKKVKKTRSLTIGLRAGERITTLSAALLKGKKAVGRGKLSTIEPGSGKMKIKLARKAAKKFKKGTYTLSFTGTRADGRRATGSAQIRVR